MHDLSDNKFISELCGTDDITLNAFMFGGHTVEKRVESGHFFDTVCDMLALLSFNIHLSGYKYLTELTVMYLVCENFDEDVALCEIAEHYGTDVRYVVAGIRESISRNTDFISAASRLLHVQLHTCDCKRIKDALDILSAVFKLHYNFTADEDEFINSKTFVMPVLG